VRAGTPAIIIVAANTTPPATVITFVRRLIEAFIIAPSSVSPAEFVKTSFGLGNDCAAKSRRKTLFGMSQFGLFCPKE